MTARKDIVFEPVDRDMEIAVPDGETMIVLLRDFSPHTIVDDPADFRAAIQPFLDQGYRVNFGAGIQTTTNGSAIIQMNMPSDSR